MHLFAQRKLAWTFEGSTLKYALMSPGLLGLCRAHRIGCHRSHPMANRLSAVSQATMLLGSGYGHSSANTCGGMPPELLGTRTDHAVIEAACKRAPARNRLARTSDA